jgi:hypothetical protein
MPGQITTINGLESAVYLRGLNKVTNNTYLEVDDFLGQMFKVTGVDEADIKEMSYVGLPDAQPWDAGVAGLSIAEMQERYQIYAMNGWISQGTAYTRPMKQWSRHKEMTNGASQLGATVGRYKQRAGIAVYLGGNTVNWNATEGLPWFYTAHPLVISTAGANAYYSNLVTGGPSIETLQDACTLMIGTPDDLGTTANYRPKTLFVSTNRYPIWDSIVGVSGGRSDDANHSKNLFFGGKYKVNVVACPWIPPAFDTYAFLVGNKHGAVWNNAVTFETSMEYEKKTQNTYHWAVAAFCNYIRDWRGTVMIQG